MLLHFQRDPKSNFPPTTQQPAQFDQFELQNGSKLLGEMPLTILGPSQPWSYAAAFPNLLSVAAAARLGDVSFNVEITVLSGNLSIGLLYSNNKSFISQTEVIEHNVKKIITLESARLSDASALIFRNSSTSSPLEFIIHGVQTSNAKFSVPTLRGFHDKSIIEDIYRLSNGAIYQIFDVGANVGDMTAQFLAAFPEATLHAFEPHPTTAEHTASRFASNDRVIVHNCALGDASSELELHCYANSAINALSPISLEGERHVDGAIASTGTMKIRVDTVDQFLRLHSIGNLDLLKIDTQGSELSVLRDFLENGKALPGWRGL